MPGVSVDGLGFFRVVGDRKAVGGEAVPLGGG